MVYLSKAEGFGLPPLEAAALKVPVICSNTTAMSDYSFFENNHIDPEDTNALKERMSQIISSSPAEPKLEAISEKLKKEYSWEASAEKLYGLITRDAQNTHKVRQQL
jgi:glycosyltransferase involved in cell wall biosynthesis